MTMNEFIGVGLISILIYFEAYALVSRICTCFERCYYKHCANKEEFDDGK